MDSLAAEIATNRFGLGARPGELARVRKDPRGWLDGQLGVVDGPPGMEHIGPLSARLHRAAQRSGKEGRTLGREIYELEAAARERHAAMSRSPFQERLVRFWGNHFAVSVAQLRCVGLVGNFEREAIRPYLGGHFRELLGAVVHHPAMLLYLDQVRSVGPQSQVGQRHDKGLNENLARELMELHTLGVDGGYVQDDVESLARVLTGWTLSPARARRDPFVFDPKRHEPGERWLLGERLRAGGEEQGQEALDLLAEHPSTAQHIATKLVRHFVGDTPNPWDVHEIARVFQDTEGHLPSLHAAVVRLESAWDPAARKLRTPADLVTAMARGIGYEGDGQVLVEARRSLGQLPWAAASPQGWPDTWAHWAGPDAMLARVDLARRLADRAKLQVNASELAARLMGGLMPARERVIIASLQLETDGIAVLLASPSFQWRGHRAE